MSYDKRKREVLEELDKQGYDEAVRNDFVKGLESYFALREGRLGGAALDVFETEPLPAGSPLAGCPNLILPPHIAGVTRESNVRVSTMIAEKVAAALKAIG